jgi:hypothetical protein
MYVPQVNDYVIWNDGKGVEGWVYFKDDEYITIEVCVRPKDCINYEACNLHRNERLLVLCYKNRWKELVYVRSRESVYEETENSMEMVG